MSGMRRDSAASPMELKRHNSTCVAFSEKSAKLTPRPSHVAPSGYGRPGRAFTASTRGCTVATRRSRCAHTLGPPLLGSKELSRRRDRRALRQFFDLARVSKERNRVAQHELRRQLHRQPPKRRETRLCSSTTAECIRPGLGSFEDRGKARAVPQFARDRRGPISVPSRARRRIALIGGGCGRFEHRH